jgi:tetratricopeptide (TPR) repeat protein
VGNNFGFWGGPYWGFDYPWDYDNGSQFWYAPVADDSYWNPFYTSAYLYGGYDYAAPIPQNAQAPDDDQSFAAAREAFYAGDYNVALLDINQAVRNVPGNEEIHQFHALVYFAMGDYHRAAAVAHAVLEGGPGWNWSTLQSFYASTNTYTQQLRALESYVGEHPDDPAGRFELGYQYLMLGYLNAARLQLARVVALEPRDNLTGNLVAGLGGTQHLNSQKGFYGETAGLSGQPATLAADVMPLVGTWKATPAPRATIVATLQPDGRFIWNATQGGQAEPFTGTYVRQGDSLVFNRNDGQKMDGIVTLKGSDAFQFRLKNTDPNDPGLEFSR